MKSNILGIAITFIIAFVLGIFCSEGLRNLFSTKCCKPQKSETVYKPNWTLPDIKKPASDFSAQWLAAHNLAVGYRIYDNLKTKPSYCPTPASDKLNNIPASSIGFTEMSYANAIDMVSAMDDIRTIMSPNPATVFRIIYGLNVTNDSSRLVLVPLFDGGTGLTEKTEWGPLTDQRSLIRVLQYQPDCPLLCDFANSKILLKNKSDDKLDKANACKKY